MGPFNFPLLTFAAFLVTGASIALALVWAALDRGRGERRS